ncbi:MAG: cyclic nucleotide-binding domain-containing protein [Thalassobaculum sp.]|uniref:cyclic nucleotide-binding domain-containing protein n=1 Tax=Thalassobaculum sp. TaxID=2022740 RepID=UPI0032EC60D2
MLASLAGHFTEAPYGPGEVIVREGDPGDRLFLIAAGTVVVHSADRKRSVFMKSLGPGDMFGEMALLEPDGRRNATVTATGPVRVLSLPGAVFVEALETESGLRDAVLRLRDSILRFRFLRMASPFGALEPGMLDALSARMTRTPFTAGDELIRQGDAGDFALLIAEGEVEVVRRDDGDDRRLATLGVGAMLGEAAILTGEVRNATVRALKDGSAFRIDRDALLEMFEHDRRIGLQAIQLLRLRERPRQAPNVEVHERRAADGDTLHILKRTDTGAFFQLSESGRRLWEKLDGEATMRDIAIAHMLATKTFAPQVVADTIAALTAAGFVEVQSVTPDVSGRLAGRTTGGSVGGRAPRRIAAALQRIFVWHWDLGSGDRLIGRLYDRGGHLAYRAVGLTIIAAIILGGTAVVAFAGPEARTAMEGGWTEGRLWLVVPMIYASIVLHELGHALSVKHYGREVLGAGLGCQGPFVFAYVNTSDMWLEGRVPRLVVDASGMVVNMILAGLAGLGLLVAEDPATVAVLWLFAVFSWQIVLVNLNPFFDLDGYYLLSDWLDRPNLREKSFRRFLDLVRSGDLTIARRHPVEIAYTAFTLVYVSAMGVVLFLVYRPLLAAWFGDAVPALPATLGALAVALLWYASSAAFLSRSVRFALAASRNRPAART